MKKKQNRTKSPRWQSRILGRLWRIQEQLRRILERLWCIQEERKISVLFQRTSNKLVSIIKKEGHYCIEKGSRNTRKYTPRPILTIARRKYLFGNFLGPAHVFCLWCLFAALFALVIRFRLFLGKLLFIGGFTYCFGHTTYLLMLRSQKVIHRFHRAEGFDGCIHK